MRNFLLAGDLLCLLAATCFMAAPSAQAQGYTGGADGGGVYYQPNFEGDRRNDDLYRIYHPSTNPQWDAYRQLLYQIAQQSMSAVGQVRQDPQGSNAGYANAASIVAGPPAPTDSSNGGGGASQQSPPGNGATTPQYGGGTGSGFASGSGTAAGGMPNQPQYAPSTMPGGAAMSAALPNNTPNYPPNTLKLPHKNVSGTVLQPTTTTTTSAGDLTADF